MLFSTLLASLPTYQGNLPIDPAVTGVISDTRKVTAGTVFVCLDGLHYDSHTGLDDAILRGAAAFVIDAHHEKAADYLHSRSIPFAVVPDTRAALSFLLASVNGDPQKKLTIIGVTGTNGKTTIVTMIEAILREAHISCRSIGTLTGSMTTPDPEELYPLLAACCRSGITHVVMECSSHALALKKLSPLTPAIAVFTNLTPEHRDFHGDMEHYASAKAELFRCARRAVINTDSPYADLIAQVSHGTVYRCSMQGNPADYHADAIVSCGMDGMHFDLRGMGEVLSLSTPLPGRFSVMNTMEAVVCCLLLGIPSGIICRAVSAFAGVPGRMERLPLPTDNFTVCIDYAHTPDALQNTLRTYRDIIGKEKRLILLFGCGGDRDREKRQEMGKIGAAYADYIILTADNSRSESTEEIIAEILPGIGCDCPYIVIPNRRDAIRYGIFHAKGGDVLLLCGKGHETYEITNTGKHPFSERAVVEEAVLESIKNKASNDKQSEKDAKSKSE